MPRRRRVAILARGGLPAVVVLAVFFVIPTINFLRLSFSPYTSPAVTGEGFTWENYELILSAGAYRHAVLETFILSSIVAVVTTLVAYPAATAIVRGRRSPARALFVVIIASMFTSVVVRALGWQVILSHEGIVNKALISMHIVSSPVDIMGTPAAVGIGLVQFTLPFCVLAMLPVIETVPRVLLEQADGLGASRWYRFSRVTFPLTRVGVVYPALLVFALSAGAFATPVLLGQGRVGVLSIYVRQETLTLLNYPQGAVFASLILAIVFIVFALGIRYQSRRGKQRRLKAKRLLRVGGG